MTIAEIQSLSHEDRRVKCAELSGWKIGRKKFQRTDGWHTVERWEHPTLPCCGGGGLYGWDYNDEPSILSLPNYDANLNACAELERTLTDQEWYRYQEALHETSKPDPSYSVRHYISASAPARVTAFLLTKFSK